MKLELIIARGRRIKPSDKVTSDDCQNISRLLPLTLTKFYFTSIRELRDIEKENLLDIDDRSAPFLYAEIEDLPNPQDFYSRLTAEGYTIIDSKLTQEKN